MRQLLMLMALPVLCTPAFAQTEIPIVGTWVTLDEAEITIAPCPTGLCGYLSKIVIPEERFADSMDKIDAIGIENLTDARNPDPALKGRPLLGMPMITLTKEVSPVRYEGELYNAEDGSIYFGIVELLDDETIRLTGCLTWLTAACLSQDWKRVPEEVVAYAMEHRDELPKNMALWNGPPETETETIPAAMPAPPMPAPSRPN